MRNQRILLLAAILSLTTACAHHHEVQTLPRDMLGKVSTIRTNDGKKTKGYATATATGLEWRAHNGELISADTVISVSEKNHWRGALYGAGLGALIGGSAGVIAGYAGGESCDEKSCTDASFTAMVLGVVGVLVGTPIGIVTGLAIGSDDTYELQRANNAPRFSLSPAANGAKATLKWTF